MNLDDYIANINSSDAIQIKTDVNVYKSQLSYLDGKAPTIVLRDITFPRSAIRLLRAMDRKFNTNPYLVPVNPNYQDLGSLSLKDVNKIAGKIARFENQFKYRLSESTFKAIIQNPRLQTNYKSQNPKFKPHLNTPRFCKLFNSAELIDSKHLILQIKISKHLIIKYSLTVKHNYWSL